MKNNSFLGTIWIIALIYFLHSLSISHVQKRSQMIEEFKETGVAAHRGRDVISLALSGENRSVVDGVEK